MHYHPSPATILPALRSPKHGQATWYLDRQHLLAKAGLSLERLECISVRLQCLQMRITMAKLRLFEFLGHIQCLHGLFMKMR